MDTRSNLRLRIRAPLAQSEAFPVEATLDGAGSFLKAEIRIPSAELARMESNPWEYGHRLGDVVFSDPVLRRVFAFARGPNGRTVSLTLQIDDEAVAAHDLLWERMIWASGDEDLAFAASPRSTLSRTIALENPVTLVPGQGPFRLLLAIASPDNLSETGPLKPVSAAAEVGSLREAWDPLVERGLLRVTILARVEESVRKAWQDAGYVVVSEEVTLDAISDRISSFDGLHLISHGAFQRGSASLMLEKAGGGPQMADEKTILKRWNQKLRLVFLQACQSATREPGKPNVWSGLAPKLVKQCSAVVAMQDFVRMEDARRFAQEFYQTLLSTGYADVAVNAGRTALFRPDSGNWAVPALFLAPNVSRIWQPDSILAAVQDLAARFRRRADAIQPFPIEVVRLKRGVSPKTESSSPGPRVGVVEAIGALLTSEEPERAKIAVLAGNYGRGKTAQLYSLYGEYAVKASRVGGPLPLFARIEHFQPSDASPEEIVGKAISKAFFQEAEIDVAWQGVAARLSAPFVLFVDGDQDADTGRRYFALGTIERLLRKHKAAAAVVTIDTNSLQEWPALGRHPEAFGRSADEESKIAVLIVQLLSRSTVAQYLNALPNGAGKAVLDVVQQGNLFDLARVPWLLSVLIQHSSQTALSRSGVVERCVENRLSEVSWRPGMRRIVTELLGRIAWTMQQHQTPRLVGSDLFDLLARVRGNREIPLDQLRLLALETRIVCPSEEDGIRFMYPGFQSHFCAQHLLASASTLERRLDDITATLGRRNRVRLWEDVLVLLSGLTEKPDMVVRSILSGTSLNDGDQVFLATTCIHEAKLRNRKLESDVSKQVLDSLIRRSSQAQERSVATRARAAECLGLLRDPASVPHLISLAIEPVRGTDEGATFEYSGIRQAALEALLSMQSTAEEQIKELGGPAADHLAPLIEAWKSSDCATLRQLFSVKEPGIPAIAAFALATLGSEENLNFLSERILDPSAPNDTLWAIADALLQFNPADVTVRAIRPMCQVESLHSLASYLIGRLGIATDSDPETAFLRSCLKSADHKTQGMSIRARAMLAQDDHRELCELIATRQWEHAAAHAGVTFSEGVRDQCTLEYYALEALRRIGNQQTTQRLREARATSAPGAKLGDHAVDLNQLSYEVSEDIYWRTTGGANGESFRED